jgi:hypothetical protein
MANAWIQHLKSESARLKISYRDAMKDKRVKDSYKPKKTDTLQSAIKPIPALRQKGRLVVGGKSKKEKTLDEELEEIDAIPIKTTPIIPPKPVKTIPVIPPKPEKLVKLVKTMKNIKATKIQKAFRKKQAEKAEEELTQMLKTTKEGISDELKIDQYLKKLKEFGVNPKFLDLVEKFLNKQISYIYKTFNFNKNLQIYNDNLNWTKGAMEWLDDICSGANDMVGDRYFYYTESTEDDYNKYKGTFKRASKEFNINSVKDDARKYNIDRLFESKESKSYLRNLKIEVPTIFKIPIIDYFPNKTKFEKKDYYQLQ